MRVPVFLNYWRSQFEPAELASLTPKHARDSDLACDHTTPHEAPRQHLPDLCRPRHPDNQEQVLVHPPEVRLCTSRFCDVLAIEPLRVLQLSWRGGHGLDSILMWRLEPEGDGTRLVIDHAGFDAADPAERLAHDGMAGG